MYPYTVLSSMHHRKAYFPLLPPVPSFLTGVTSLALFLSSWASPLPPGLALPMPRHPPMVAATVVASMKEEPRSSTASTFSVTASLLALASSGLPSPPIRISNRQRTLALRYGPEDLLSPSLLPLHQPPPLFRSLLLHAGARRQGRLLRHRLPPLLCHCLNAILQHRRCQRIGGRRESHQAHPRTAWRGASRRKRWRRIRVFWNPVGVKVTAVSEGKV